MTQAGSLYLALVGGGVVFLALMTTFGNILRAKGRPRISMVVSLLTNVLNAILSSLAIFVGHWGIIGVSYSYGFLSSGWDSDTLASDETRCEAA